MGSGGGPAYARRELRGLAACLAAALAIAGCGGGSPKARLDGSSSDARDGGDARDGSDARDLRTDTGETGPETRSDAADSARDAFDAPNDRGDTATGGTAGAGGIGGSDASGTGTGGMGTGGMGIGGTDAGGTGSGGMGTGGMGTGGAGTGGTGSGGMGTGGVGTGGMGTGGTAGSDLDGGDDAPADVAGDVPQNGTGGGGGSDASAEGGSDTGGCGVGCPSNVRPDALAIWLAADVGVQCDTNSRVSNWTNVGTLGGSATPPSGKRGPLCANPTKLAGRDVPYFDASGADDTDGVLTLDLTPLVGHGYTVFVVERRQAATEGYFLGSSLPGPAVIDCPSYAHYAYRFGYMPPYLTSGPYVLNDSEDDCFAPLGTPLAFSPGNPQAALDVEVFDAAAGHTLLSNGTSLGNDMDMTPIASLPDGFLGRAFQAVTGHSSRFKGDIAELVIYADTLTGPQILDVSNYLAARWGVTLTH
jgi:hypothetical protein